MKYTMMIVVGGKRISVKEVEANDIDEAYAVTARKFDCKIGDICGCMPHEPMCVQKVEVPSLMKSTRISKPEKKGAL